MNMNEESLISQKTSVVVMPQLLLQLNRYRVNGSGVHYLIKNS